MGIELTSPTGGPRARRAGAVVHPRRRRRQPAGDGRGLRHVRRPRPALRRPPGDRDPRHRRQRRSRTTPSSASRCCPAPVADAVNDVLARRDGARRLRQRRRHRHQPGLGRQDRDDQQPACRCGSSATPRTSRPPSMIAGANQEGHRITLERPDLGGSYIYAASGSGTAGPMWGDAMQRDRSRPGRRGLPAAQRHSEIAGVLTTGARASAGSRSSRPQQTLDRGRLQPVGGRLRQLRGRRRAAVAYSSPGAGDVAEQRATPWCSTPPPATCRRRSPARAAATKGRRATAADGADGPAPGALSRAGGVPRRPRRRRRRGP